MPMYAEFASRRGTGQLQEAAARQLPLASRRAGADARLEARSGEGMGLSGMDRQELRSRVAAVAATVIGMSAVVPEQPLALQGMDSLAAMELRHKLQVQIKQTPWQIARIDR
jgi:Phosphopantetheine attachment site